MGESEQTSRAAKRTPRLSVFRRRQTALWCRCGSPRIARHGLCSACYAREQRDRRFYAGHRAAVVLRDGQICRLCAAACLGPASLVVHHRRPGRSRLPWLVALCRACHARVHRLRVVRAVYPAAFLQLWREQHPDAHEQLAFSFEPPVVLPEPRRLFEEDHA